uniref:Saposin B-type domain-containing protein n=1 Tax=Panagrolaimus superbus TaxID=310955 RepID=A0A914Z010_9BILA
MADVKFFAVLIVIAFVGIVTSFTLPNQHNQNHRSSGASEETNCSACETIYRVALSHLKPEYIANATSARSFMIGECNMFRQQHVPFWPFCFEMYTQNFDAFWQDLKSATVPLQACKALEICQ